jgi:hypothetical protein
LYNPVVPSSPRPVYIGARPPASRLSTAELLISTDTQRGRSMGLCSLNIRRALFAKHGRRGWHPRCGGWHPRGGAEVAASHCRTKLMKLEPERDESSKSHPSQRMNPASPGAPHEMHAK